MEASEHRVGWVPAPRQGWVAPHVAAEFPGLGIAWTEVDCRPRRSPEPVRRRLRDLSDRFYGSHAVQMRTKAIPWAYRTFFRQIGLDPVRNRTPVEQLALERLFDGGFKSRGMPGDALTVAIVTASAGSPCGLNAPSRSRSSARSSTGVLVRSGSSPIWRKKAR